MVWDVFGNICVRFSFACFVCLCASSVSVTLSLAVWLLFWSFQFPSHCVRLSGPETNSRHCLSQSVSVSVSWVFLSLSPLKSVTLSFSTSSKSLLSLSVFLFLSLEYYTFVVTLLHLNALITTSADLFTCTYRWRCSDTISSQLIPLTEVAVLADTSTDPILAW